jgi:putative hemolysin
MWGAVVFLLLIVLALAAYADRIYFEQGKFLSREYEENIEAWERAVEPQLKIGREQASAAASILRQVVLATLAFMFAFRLHAAALRSPVEILRTAVELLLVVLIFDRLLPQIAFTQTRGLWATRWAVLYQVLFYLALPITLTLGLLLSIASLAEPEGAQEEEHPSEAMDALLEAGEEEGVLDEQDRELVRSVVEFGDKVVLEVMTPRPEMFAVPATMTLEEFTAQVNEHNFSRVPVYGASLDEVTGIAFARDLLLVRDVDAGTRKVSHLARPAAFVPETKKVNELLREMQREKQHMQIVIDEYGAVAGLVTIEDLLEAIVGEIEDEHDEEADEAPVAEQGGAFVVPGSFETARLRELFADQMAAREAANDALDEDAASESMDADAELPQMLSEYEATTVGGLVSEMAGHIPHAGEVVEEAPLRLEVIASTDRLVERVRVSLAGEPGPVGPGPTAE